MVSVESPLRDVAYFLQMSVRPDALLEHERRLVSYYLERLRLELRAKGAAADADGLSIEWAWRMYRAHTFYSLAATIITAGGGDFVQSAEVARELVSRAQSACDRVDARGMLGEILGVTQGR